MKKTLFGVLAFVLVLATVLTGTLLAADGDTAEGTRNIGKVKMVDAAHPIQVDGKMDEAYTTAEPLVIGMSPKNAPKDVYTHGIARFVWSKATNMIYCYVIVNDVEVNGAGKNPWESDSVEMFIDFTNTGKQEWGIAGLKGDGVLNRGLQYRIEGFNGQPSCYVLEENKTYEYDEDKGRMFVNGGKLITDTTNIFGWSANTDLSKQGWGFQQLDTGYAVEFGISADGQGITLKDGQAIRFDFQMNDRYSYNPVTNSALQYNRYYNGGYRETMNEPTAGASLAYYDTFTLSEEVVKNDSIIPNNKLAEYGAADASVERTTSAKPTSRTTTKKVTIDRVFTTKKDDGGKVTTNNGGTQATGNNGGTTTTAASGSSGGGCGSSIAVGSSLAMLAAVGAAGFFAFRRKKDDEE